MARRHNTPSRPNAQPVYAPAPETAAAAAPDAPTTDEYGLPLPPEGWCKGQLLNVRNAGSHYNVTLEGEEYNPRAPERCLQFTNIGECQNFVSRWYAREAGGPP